MSQPVLSVLRDGVRTITLNRPDRLNAMNMVLIEAVGDAFAAANADPETRVVIFTGAGGAFCAGDDLKEHRHPESEAEARAVVDAIQRATREIVFGDRIVVGAINGWAVGGGFEWATNCDFPIWAESAKGFLPEVSWGLFVTGGVTASLPHLVGLNRAREMLLLGERYSAAQLLDMGLAWRVVPDDRLLDEARKVAAKIAGLPARSVADMKKVIVRTAFGDAQAMARAMDLESEATVRAFLDPETTARIKGFAGSG
jgi:enoyl-CoA hydratase/carnithine racemase